MTVTLRIDGPPTGKARPRFVRATGRTYTPSSTVHAEDRVRSAWEHAGQPFIDGPVSVTLESVVARPGNHFRVNGELSKAGLAAVWPTKKPDLDNLLKLVADALNGCAYRDDSQIVRAVLSRRYCRPGEREHTLLTLAAPDAGGLHVLGRMSETAA